MTRPTFRTVLLTGAGLCALALAAVVLLVAAPGLAGADDAYVVRSGSMAPAIEAGDLVLVAETPPGEIETGDVITYRTRAESADGRSGLVTHRVVGTGDAAASDRTGASEHAFRTKGDANDRADPGQVSGSAVVGRVIAVVPVVGHVVAFAASDTGVLALVIGPLSLLVAGEIYDLVRAYRAGRREESR